MQRELLDPLRDQRWQTFIDCCQSAQVFHHPAWLQLLRDLYGYDIQAWTVLDGDRIAAGLPVARVESHLTGRRLVAIPFSDLCGPLVAGNGGGSGAAAAELLAMIASEQQRAGIPLDIHEQVAGLPHTHTSRQFFHHALALADDPATVEAGFTKSQVKRGARKAAKAGLRVERHTDVGALDEFYRLHLETRRHQGVPIQPRRFIRSFAELFGRGLGHVALVAEGSGRAIAAAVFLTLHGTLTYKYGASDRSALNLRPNNLLFLDTIHWGCEHGMRELDLGRTDLDNEGLREFKLSWGATERELSYTWLSDRKAPGKGGGVPSLLRTGIRRLPRSFGQAVGTALYRHTA